MRHTILYLLLLLPIAASPAAFQNLNFEQATITPTPVGGGGSSSVDSSIAFPGWTVESSSTWYNNFPLSISSQVLVGPNFPNGLNMLPLQGSYSALLYNSFMPSGGNPALSQTGLVPGDAHYITFLTSGLSLSQVSLNGQVLSLFDFGGGREAADISAYAGQVATVEFSTTGGQFYFDDVTFSSVPEPGTLSLLFLGVLFGPYIYWRSRKRR